MRSRSASPRAAPEMEVVYSRASRRLVARLLAVVAKTLTARAHLGVVADVAALVAGAARKVRHLAAGRSLLNNDLLTVHVSHADPCFCFAECYYDAAAVTVCVWYSASLVRVAIKQRGHGRVGCRWMGEKRTRKNQIVPLRKKPSACMQILVSTCLHAQTQCSAVMNSTAALITSASPTHLCFLKKNFTPSLHFSASSTLCNARKERNSKKCRICRVFRRRKRKKEGRFDEFLTPHHPAPVRVRQAETKRRERPVTIILPAKGGELALSLCEDRG